MLATIFAGVAGANAFAAADPLKIVRVGTDAMGSDTFANRNREYVVLRNVSGGPVDLNGLKVEDNWAHVNGGPSTCNTYMVTGSVMLAHGSFVTVYNGAGTDDVLSPNKKFYANSNVNCGTEGHFLNNEADTVWANLGVWVGSKSWDWNGGYFVF